MPPCNLSALDFCCSVKFGDEKHFICTLSCMTLDVEDLHSTVHTKHAILSKLQYSQSFGYTMKESLKCLTSWVAYYHTSRKSWYSPPEKTVYDIPQISPLPVVSMKDEHQQEVCDYGRIYGRAVRQRTNRQETTMAKHRELPDYVYQRELADSSTYLRQDQSTSEKKALATVERTSIEQE